MAGPGTPYGDASGPPHERPAAWNTPPPPPPGQGFGGAPPPPPPSAWPQQQPVQPWQQQQPGAPWAQPGGPWQPGGPAPQRGGRAALIAGVAAVAAAAVIAIAVLAVSHHGTASNPSATAGTGGSAPAAPSQSASRAASGSCSSAPQAGTPVPPDSGCVVDNETFGTSSAWFTGSQPSGTTWSLTGSGYVAVPKGNLVHTQTEPGSAVYPAVSVSATATQTGGDVSGSGFGVFCAASGKENHIEFTLYADGGWSIDQRTGAGGAPANLTSGRVAPTVGASHTIAGACITLGTTAGTARIRVLLWVDGTQVADRQTSWANFPGGEWDSGVLVADGANATGQQDTFTTFEVRNLG